MSGANRGPVLFIAIIILTANGFYPGGSGTTIRHNTQNYSHNKHPTQNEYNNHHNFNYIN
jgi:hypothetical protein